MENLNTVIVSVLGGLLTALIIYLVTLFYRNVKYRELFPQKKFRILKSGLYKLYYNRNERTNKKNYDLIYDYINEAKSDVTLIGTTLHEFFQGGKLVETILNKLREKNNRTKIAISIFDPEPTTAETESKDIIVGELFKQVVIEDKYDPADVKASLEMTKKKIRSIIESLDESQKYYFKLTPHNKVLTNNIYAFDLNPPPNEDCIPKIIIEMLPFGILPRDRLSFEIRDKDSELYLTYCKSINSFLEN